MSRFVQKRKARPPSSGEPGNESGERLQAGIVLIKNAVLSVVFLCSVLFTYLRTLSHPVMPNGAATDRAKPYLQWLAARAVQAFLPNRFYGGQLLLNHCCDSLMNRRFLFRALRQRIQMPPFFKPGSRRQALNATCYRRACYGEHIQGRAALAGGGRGRLLVSGCHPGQQVHNFRFVISQKGQYPPDRFLVAGNIQATRRGQGQTYTLRFQPFYDLCRIHIDTVIISFSPRPLVLSVTPLQALLHKGLRVTFL